MKLKLATISERLERVKKKKLSKKRCKGVTYERK